MGLARRIVDAAPDACWMKQPVVVEDDTDSETPFESAWNILIDRLPVFNRLRTLDKMCGRGLFSVMLLGFDDGGVLEKEVKEGSNPNLLFMRVYHPQKVSIIGWETNNTSERFGAPVMYQLKMTDRGGTEQEKKVHWTRILHLADDVEEQEWTGEHRLHKVFNHILDIEKISGGGAEMFWRGGFPGMGFEMDKDAGELTTSRKEEIDKELTTYMHGLSRFFKVRGIKATQFSPSVANPKTHFMMQIQLISAATGIPARILLGSEEAQLASEQDTGNWLDRVTMRRTAFCEPMVLKQFIGLLVRSGTLPKPEKIVVQWPDLRTRDPKQEAEVIRITTEALVKWADSVGSANVMSLFHYLTLVHGMSQDKANMIVKAAEGLEPPPPVPEEMGV